MDAGTASRPGEKPSSYGEITEVEEGQQTVVGSRASSTIEKLNRSPVATEGSTPPPTKAASSALQSTLVVAAVTTAMIVNVANATVVSISLPTMGREWGLEEAELQWPVSAYPLSAGCLLLVFGRIADLYGRKKTFVVGSVFSTIMTLACGFANNVLTLDVLRGIQGVGSAATIPASLGILAHHFPPSRARSFAFATFSAGAPIGGIFGTAFGGILTQYTSETWRSGLWLMAGVTALSAIMGIVSVKPDRPEELPQDKRVDWLGSFLVTAGLVLIVFVLSQGEIAPKKWETPYIIALLITGVILLVLFVFWEHYLEKIQDDPDAPISRWTPPPIMRVSLWKRADGKYAAMMIIAFVNWCSFLAWAFWAQLYYQNYVRLSAIQTVLRFIPMTVSGILCNILVGLTAARVPVVYLAGLGTAATGCASLLFALIDPEKTFWAYGFPAAVISVMGADFVFSAGTLYVAKVSLPHEQSVSGAIFNTMTNLGTAVGVTVSTVVFNQVREKNPDGNILKSYQAANWTGFAFGMVGMVLSILFFRNVGVVGDRKPKKPSLEENQSTSTGPETPLSDLDEKQKIGLSGKEASPVEGTIKGIPADLKQS